MRCKQHYTDLSSNVGVCASCLRERLFPLVIAQQPPHNSETHPDQVFPQSVSPYISRRKTSTKNQHNSYNNHHHYNNLPDRRFFSTPQVARTTRSYNNNSCQKKNHSFISFSFLSNLFRSKKRKDNSNPRSSVCHDSATSAMSSDVCREKQPYCSDRGMSPVRYSDCDGAEDEFYETSEPRKQTPWRTAAHPSVRGGGYGKSVSGISFCLSPLVRVSPCRNRNQQGVMPVDYGGEIGGPVKGHRCNNTRTFCGNRSRKVADFGRIVTDR